MARKHCSQRSGSQHSALDKVDTSIVLLVMAFVTAPYSCFAGKTFVVAEQVSEGKLGSGVYLIVEGRRLWFGNEAVKVM
jgi:hypothetical protein